jgi:hypothetical protein
MKNEIHKEHVFRIFYTYLYFLLKQQKPGG